jgi:phosphotransferase system  glucose/maltose/N-acetylglucosamine-specific IIC component
MQNRTAAIIITIVLVLLCICPGLGALCLGVGSLFDYAAGTGLLASDQNTYLGYIFGGSCGGLILIIIAAVIIFFLFRKKKVTPPPPTPPTTPDEPIPPAI